MAETGWIRWMVLPKRKHSFEIELLIDYLHLKKGNEKNIKKKYMLANLLAHLTAGVIQWCAFPDG